MDKKNNLPNIEPLWKKFSNLNEKLTNMNQLNFFLNLIFCNMNYVQHICFLIGVISAQVEYSVSIWNLKKYRLSPKNKEMQ